jgi:hypothetical protein
MVVPSEEQMNIINAIKEGNNVSVNACAGSGKSTTVLSCAKILNNLKILQITFNKQLQSEVQEKIIEEKLKNIQVYTYHGLAVRYYSSSCHNDTGIRINVLAENCVPCVEIPKIDIMVIDEIQDMTKLYFDLLWKFLIDMNNPIQLLILGDVRQGLYEFKGSDIRFLSFSRECWKKLPTLKNKEFINLPLKTSYRVTNPISHFINEVMFGDNILNSCKEGEKVTYIRRQTNQLHIIHKMISHIKNTRNASYNDFFILCRSLRISNKPIRYLENLLVENNIPCFIPNTDFKEDLDTRVIENKVVFSTFHASKGRQRPYVFVLGFDDSHFTYFARDKDPNTCPNELYVACSRASEKLFVWENIDKNIFSLPFLKKNHNDFMTSKYVNFQGLPSGRKPINETIESYEVKKHIVKPSELIRFLPECTLDKISPVVESIFTTIQEDSTSIDIPNVIQTSTGYCEDISDINGIVLPIMFFDKYEKKTNPIIQNLIKNHLKDVSEKKHPFLYNIIQDSLPDQCNDIQDYLYSTNILTSVQELLYSRLKQIPYKDYNWISDHSFELCFSRLSEVFKNEGNLYPEVTIIDKNSDIEHINIDKVIGERLKDIDTIYRFSGRADIFTDKSLWELKFTSQLTMDHKLQLIIYSWIYILKTNSFDKKFYLFNIKTNECLQLNANLEQLTFIVIEILKGKYYEPVKLTDEEFLQQFL